MSVLPNPEEPPKIEIDPEEILRVYNLMGNLIEFFHQPMHYPDQQAVLDFLNSGVYDEMSDVYYKLMWKWLPGSQRHSIENA